MMRASPLEVALAALLAAAAGLPGAHAHGWLQEPAARNWLVAGQRNQANGQGVFYGPMNLNRPGNPTNGATCGGEFKGDTRFEVGGKFARRKIVKTYTSGQTIDTVYQVYINHWGYLQFHLCPLKGTNDAAEKASLSASCLAKYPLKMPDGRKKLWMYTGGPGTQRTVTTSWKLPKGVRCDRCVLQVTYVTGHMCYLPGVDKQRMLKVQPGGSRPCPTNYLGLDSLPVEKFWNCADIRIK